MRSYPSGWSKVLAQLGFRRKVRRHKRRPCSFGRHSRIEQLEPRQMLATTYYVTTPADVSIAGVGAVGADSEWSLREALTAAAGSPGTDTITFASSLNGGTITLSGTSLLVTSSVTIIGPGADLLTIHGNGASRVFNVSSGVEATMRGLTVTGGYAGDGGGIYNSGELTLDQVIVKTNDATNMGGGVYVASTGYLTLTNSTIDDNDAIYGGAIFGHFNTGTRLIVTGSTISNNRAASGAGINFFSVASTGSAVGTIDRSTISNNIGNGGVRVRYSSANLTITNSTIAYNKGDYGGGLSLIDSSNVTLTNTIISENRNAANTADNDIQGVGTPTGTYNLIGKGGNGGLTGTGNVTLTSGSALLAPLGDYGGKTRTHALLVNSPALDKGFNSLAGAADQRGAPRPVDLAGATNVSTGNYADIGAFEAGESTVLTVRVDNDRNNSPAVDDLSLREAIALAATLAGKENIVFAPSTYADGAIVLSYDSADSGPAPDVLAINSPISIQGPGADRLTIDADGAGNVLNVSGSASGSDFSGLKLSGATGYGLSQTAAHVQLEAVEIAENGGGIYVVAGSVTARNTTIADNTGQGVELNSTSSSFTNSTISGNQSSGSVGGISTIWGGVTLVNVTVTNNRAQKNSTTGLTGVGGIYAGNATSVVLHNSIVAENYAGQIGSDIHADLGRQAVNNPGSGFYPASISGTYNLIGDVGNSGVTTTPTNGNVIIGTSGDPGLLPLGDYGGPTRTHALESASPAIDKGSNTLATAAVDQRGYHRKVSRSTSTHTVDIGAFELGLVVSTAVDDSNSDDSYGYGDLSLRNALFLAASIPGINEIEFDADLLADETIELTYGQLTVGSDVSILGLGADSLTIDANRNSRVFYVSPGVTATISGLTITGGGNVTEGGGILSYGNLTLDEVAVVDNEVGGYVWASGGGISSLNYYGSYAHAQLHLLNSTVDGNRAYYGGGVRVQVENGGVLKISGSTISNNVALDTTNNGLGGGMWLSVQPGGEALITNSTFSGNSSGAGGALMLYGSELTIINSTITDNHADVTGGTAGGIQNSSGVIVTMHNSILAGNTATSATYKDHWGSVGGTAANPSSYNILGIQHTSILTSAADHSDLTNGVLGNQVGSQVGTQPGPRNPLLAPLGDYGGLTRTHALFSTSPALDKGNPSAVPGSGGVPLLDQRGFDRILNGDSVPGERLDIGALEAPPIPAQLVVSTAADELDDNYSSGDLSLREALYLAYLKNGADTITFDAATFASATTIELSRGELLIKQNVTIEGPGADKLRIDAHQASRVLYVGAGSIVTLRGATLTGGSADAGGGVYVDSAPFSYTDLRIEDSEIRDNSATGSGGGVYVNSHEYDEEAEVNVTLKNSTVAGNTAYWGGGVHGAFDSQFNGSLGLYVINSTVSGNRAISDGGGLFLSASGTGQVGASIVNSTITDNETSTGIGGGIFGFQDVYLELHNTILAGNRALASAATADLAGAMGSFSSYNLLGKDVALPTGPGNIRLLAGQTAGLATLGDYGGPTRTHALLPGSLAINAGDDEESEGNYDQRATGNPRIIGAAVDVGAFEADTTPGSVYFVVDPSGRVYIGNDVTQVAQITLGATVADSRRFLTINGVNTTILADDVSAIDILGGDIDERIDLSQVTRAAFPNLLEYGVSIVAAPGDDLVFGSEFADIIDAGAGNDRIFGGGGNDDIDGGVGDDWLIGEAGNDVILGSGDNDSIDGGDGADTLRGGSGNDVVRGGAQSDHIYGDDDEDELYGEGGGDFVWGGGGGDRIDGGAGSNYLDGEDANDVYLVSNEPIVNSGGTLTRFDQIVDSSGEDALDFSDWHSASSIGVHLDLTNAGVNYYDDSHTIGLIESSSSGIQNVTGTRFNDVLIGNALANRLDGAEGEDEIRGGAGDDILLGGLGPDDLFGDAGSDSLHGGEGNDELAGGSNTVEDQAYGGMGDDVYWASIGASATTFYEGAGDDRYAFPDGNVGFVMIEPESVGAASGADMFDFSLASAVNLDLSAAGTQAVIPGELILQIADDSQPSGGAHIENVTGSIFDDEIKGDAGDNELHGRGGRDVLDGGGGSDVLLGEADFDAPEVIDDAVVDSISYYQSGVWQSTTGGFNRGEKYAVGAASPTAQSSWLFSNLDYGKYEVYVSWAPDPADLAATGGTAVGASNAPFSVFADASATFAVNQRLLPQGELADGVLWQRMGGVFYPNSSDEIQVGLTNQANGRVYADAVRLGKHNEAPTLHTAGNQTIGNQTVAANVNLNVGIIAGDPDGSAGALEFQLVGNYPAGLTLVDNGPGQAILKWPSTGRPTGQWPVTIVVTDGGFPPKTTQETFLVNAGPANAAPTALTLATTIDGLTVAGTNFELVEGQTLVIDIVSTGANLSYSVDANAPSGAGFSDSLHPNRFIWTPTHAQALGELQEIKLRVTTDGNPPLRRSATITVRVSPKPKIDSLELFEDTFAPATPNGDSDRVTANPTIVGSASGGRLDGLQVLVDYNYAGSGDVQIDATTVVVESDGDPDIGEFAINLPATAFSQPGGVFQPMTVGVQLRAWNSAANSGSGAYVRSAVATITVTPNLSETTTPLVTLELVDAMGGSSPAETVNPTVQGIATRAGAALVDRKVKVYDVDPATGTPSAPILPLATLRTDGSGAFSYTRRGLAAVDGGASDPDGLTNGSVPWTLWFTVVETTVNGEVETTAEEIDLVYVVNQPPNIVEIELFHDTGTNQTNGITQNSTVVGRIAHDDGSLPGVTIEFDDDNDGVIDGTAVTDEEGRFTYLPVKARQIADVPSLGYGELNARPTEADEYQGRLLYADWLDTPIPLTLDAHDNAPPRVTLLQPLYQVASGPLSNPTVWGTVSSDDGREDVAVEISRGPVNTATGKFNPQDLLGLAYTNEDGRFEFTPVGLPAGEAVTIYARAVEWDPQQAAGDEYLYDNSAVASTSFTLSDVPLSAGAIAGLTLAFDSGVNGSNGRTSDPTLTGTVNYVGDYSDVTIEFDHDNNGTTDGTAVPDAAGRFYYTPAGLANNVEVTIRARVRVPDFAVRNDAFGDDLLAWYTTGYDTTAGQWSQEALDAWFETIFNAEGTDFAGQWYNGPFERDWSALFGDYATDFAEASKTFTLDLSENLSTSVAGFGLVAQPSPHIQPTVAGTVVNDGKRSGLMVEFYLNGGSTPDGSTTTGEAGDFVYTFGKAVLGPNAVVVKVYETVYGSLTASVSSSSFTVAIDANPGIAVSTLGLKHGQRNSAGQIESVDPTLVGEVRVGGSAAAKLVLFDYDGDGLPDASTHTDAVGRFQFIPENFPVVSDVATVRAQVVEDVVDGDATYRTLSPWRSLSWHVVANNPPSIARLELAHDTSAALTGGMPVAGVEALDRVTIDPTLLGRVANDNSAGYMTVEFDHNGDDIVDGSAMTDGDGKFSYLPVGLPVGAVDVRARVREYDPASGEELVSDWASVTANGDPASAGLRGLTLVNASAAASIAISHAGNPQDPTVTGTVSDQDGGSNLVVEFFRNVGLDRIFVGSAPVNPDGSFVFTPVGLPFADAAHPHSIIAEVREWNYAAGAELPRVSTASPLSLAFEPTSTSFSLDIFRSNPSDRFDATVGGNVTSATGIVPQYVEIDVGNDGGVDAVVAVEGRTTGSGSSIGLGYDYRPNLISSSTLIRIQARVVGRAATGLVYSQWQYVDVDYDLELPSLADWSISDASTSTPTISGTLGVATTTSYPDSPTPPPVVEFDLDGDGVADDSTTATPTSGPPEFSYVFTSLAPGERVVMARAVRYEVLQENIEASGNYRYRTVTVPGAWEAITLSIVDPAPQVSFELTNPSAGGSPPETIDPTINGQVTSSDTSLDLEGLTVEIDHDQDGVADGTALTRQDGAFTYTPRNLALGDVTLTVRAIAPFATSGRLEGPPESLSFRLLAFAPIIDNLSLLGDEDPSAETAVTSSAPTLVGHVSTDDSVSLVTIEFDHNNDQLTDGYAIADATGNFSYRPQGLSYGSHTIRARAMAQAASGIQVGDWNADVDFFFANPSPPVVSDLVLQDATGAVAGRVTVGGFGAAATVEVAVIVGSARVTNGFAQTDGNGFFRYQARDLSLGNIQLEVRGLVRDARSNTISGDWRALDEFAYAPPAPPTSVSFTEFRLANNTGSSSSDNITGDPRILGKLSAGSPLVTVEFSHDGVNRVASASVAADGSFEYLPAGLVDGASASIYARYRVWNPATSSATTSGWLTIAPVTFTLQSSANLPARITAFGPQSISGYSGNVEITDSPAFVGSVTNDVEVAGLVVRFDHDGDGVFEGTAVTNEHGEFTYRAANLVAGAAPQTITAYVVERDYLGADLPGPGRVLPFVLRNTPRLVNATYVPTAGGQIQGAVTTSTIPAVAHIEYVLFGNYENAPTPPSSLTAFEPNAAVRTATVTSVGTFVVDLASFNLGLGAATFVMRVVDHASTAVGAWEAVRFTVTPSMIVPLSIYEFSLFEDTGAADGDTSNPAFEGDVGQLGAGAFAVVEFWIDDTDPGTPENKRIYRTNADAQGHFRFTPPDLQVGEEYIISSRHIGFDPATSQELFSGSPSSQTFTLVNNNVATIVQYGLKNSGSPPIDPTVKGYVSDNGRLAGIRVEVDTDGDDEANGFAYTDATGYFEYTPYGIAAGQSKTIRARIVEWDGVQQQYVSGNFAQATVTFTLSQDGPDDPTLEDDFAADLESTAHADSGAIDGIVSLLEYLNGGDAGAINVGIGTVELRHRGKADAPDQEPDSNEPVFVLGNQVPTTSSTTVVNQAIPASFTTLGGATLGGNYTFEKHVTVAGNVVTVAIVYEVDIVDYQQHAVFRDAAASDNRDRDVVLEVAGTYRFSYTASASYTGSGTVVFNGSHTIVESFEYDYLRTETNRSSADQEEGFGPNQTTRTNAGDYKYSYGETDAGFSGSTTSQPFHYHEETRLESWLSSSGSFSTNDGPRRSSRTYSDSEHSLYTQIVDNIGVVAVVAGAQTTSGVLTVTANGSATANHSETTTYANDFGGGNGEAGHTTRTSSAQFVGSFLGVSNYVTGQSVVTSFAYSESQTAAGREAGGGTARASADAFTQSESWDYSVGGSLTAAANASGTSSVTHSATGSHRTLSASIAASASVEHGGTAGGSISYEIQRGDIHTIGSASGSATLHGTASLSESVALTRNDDQRFIAVQGSLAYDGTYLEATGSSEQITTSTRSESGASRSILHANGGGNATYQATQSNTHVAATGASSYHSSVDRLVATQVAGKELVPDVEPSTWVPFRSNSAISASITSNGAGVSTHTESNVDGTSVVHNSSNGSTTHTRGGSARSSSYQGIAGELDGFVMGASQGSSSETTAGNYAAIDGAFAAFGTFESSSGGSSDTLTVLADDDASDGSTSSSRTSTGAKSSRNAAGSFREDDTGRAEIGVVETSSDGYASWAVVGSTINLTSDGFSTSSGTVTGKSQTSSSGTAAYASEDGQIVSESGRGQSSSTSRNTGSGSSFSLSTGLSVSVSGVTTTFHVEGGTTSSRSEESSSADGSYRTTDDQTSSTTHVTGGYSASSRDSGYRTDVVATLSFAGPDLEWTKTRSSGSTRGSMAGGGDGVITLGKGLQEWSYDIDSGVTGGYSIRTSITEGRATPSSGSSSTVMVTSSGSGDSSFDGTIAFEDGALSRNGRVERSSETSAGVKLTERSNAQSAGYGVWTVTTSSLSTSASSTFDGTFIDDEFGSNLSGHVTLGNSVTIGGSETEGRWTSSLYAGGGSFSSGAETVAEAVTLSKTTSADVTIADGETKVTNPTVTSSITESVTATTRERSAAWSVDTFTLTTRSIVETQVVRDSQTDNQDPTHTETLGYEHVGTTVSFTQGLDYTWTSTVGHSQTDTTTYGRTGNRESLTITNDAESTEQTDGSIYVTEFLYWDGYQQGGSSAGYTPITHMVTQQKQASHAEYSSSHTVAADGRSTGGKLSASSWSIWRYLAEGDRDDPPIPEETSGAQTTSTYLFSFGSQTQASEEGGYYDETLDGGALRRVASGRYRESTRSWYRWDAETETHWEQWSGGQQDSSSDHRFEAKIRQGHFRSVEGSYDPDGGTERVTAEGSKDFRWFYVDDGSWYAGDPSTSGRHTRENGLFVEYTPDNPGGSGVEWQHSTSDYEPDDSFDSESWETRTLGEDDDESGSQVVELPGGDGGVLNYDPTSAQVPSVAANPHQQILWQVMEDVDEETSTLPEHSDSGWDWVNPISWAGWSYDTFIYNPIVDTTDWLTAGWHTDTELKAARQRGDASILRDSSSNEVGVVQDDFKRSQQAGEFTTKGMKGAARAAIGFEASAGQYVQPSSNLPSAPGFGAPRRGGGAMRAQALSNLRKLGLDGVKLAGQSYNAGRKGLEAAGFVLSETTSTGRKVFMNPTTGAKVFYDSGKALAPGQKPHWHIRDKANLPYDRMGRLVGSDEIAGHIPAY
jgi:hypothetical protein